jgi:hypothetical protein
MKVLGILTALGIYTLHGMAFQCLIAANRWVHYRAPVMAKLAVWPVDMAMQQHDAGE